MKKILFTCFTILFALTLQAQLENTFTKKEKILLETGYNLLGGITSGTGLQLFTSGNETVTAIGIDGGYFISNNFALKFNIGLISTSGASLTNIGIGGKIYIVDKVPIELVAGLLTGGGNSVFAANFNVGYAIYLAENIAVEPKIGLLVLDEAVINFGIKFAMFL